jgi:hypothetical protein
MRWGDAKSRYYALGRLPKGHLNKTEQAYSDYLRDLMLAGEVLWYRFEGIKLKLADNTFLTMDFAVLHKSGVMQLIDVKGGWATEDSRIKIKIAAEMYPFRFVIVKKAKGGGWDREEFGE